MSNIDWLFNLKASVPTDVVSATQRKRPEYDTNDAAAGAPSFGEQPSQFTTPPYTAKDFQPPPPPDPGFWGSLGQKFGFGARTGAASTGSLADYTDPGIFGRPADPNATVEDKNPLLDPGIFGHPSPMPADPAERARQFLGGSFGFGPGQEPAGTGTGYDDPGIFGTPNNPQQAAGRQGLTSFLMFGGLGRLLGRGAEGGSIGIRDITPHPLELPAGEAAPASRLALPAGEARPMPGAIAGTSPRGQPWNAEGRFVPPAEPPLEGQFTELPPKEVAPAGTPNAVPPLTPGRKYTFAELQANAGIPEGKPLFNATPEPAMGVDRTVERTPTTTSVPPPVAARPVGGLTGRGIATTPITRADLNVRNPNVLTGPAAEPLSATEIGNRTGVAPIATPLTPETPLGRAMLAREPSGLVRAAAKQEPWVTPELLTKHYANDTLIAAVKGKGDVAGALDALEKSGASASNTANRLRAAGIDAPRGKITYANLRATLTPGASANEALATQKGRPFVPGSGGAIRPSAVARPTTDATLQADLQASIDALKGKGNAGTTQVPTQRGGLIDRLARGTRRFNRDDIGGGRLPGDKGPYGTPEEVAARRAALKVVPEPYGLKTRGNTPDIGFATPEGGVQFAGERTDRSTPGEFLKYQNANLESIPKSFRQRDVGKSLEDAMDIGRGIDGGAVGGYIEEKIGLVDKWLNDVGPAQAYREGRLRAPLGSEDKALVAELQSKYAAAPLNAAQVPVRDLTLAIARQDLPAARAALDRVKASVKPPAPKTNPAAVKQIEAARANGMGKLISMQDLVNNRPEPNKVPGMFENALNDLAAKSPQVKRSNATDLATYLKEQAAIYGEKPTAVAGRGNPAVRQVADAYLQDAGMPTTKVRTPVKVDPAVGKQIADFYEKAQSNPNDPAVRAAYARFVAETQAQANAIKQAGYTLEPWTKPGQPYANSAEMRADVLNNKHLYFFTGGDEHPMMTPAQNETFRGVHDFFGHAMNGNEFGPNGEENAWLAHSQMYTPEARAAMTTETRGQNSTVNFGKNGVANRANPAQTIYPEQKAILLPEQFHARPDVAPTSTPLRDRLRAMNNDEGGSATIGTALGIPTRGRGPITAAETAPFRKNIEAAFKDRLGVAPEDVKQAMAWYDKHAGEVHDLATKTGYMDAMGIPPHVAEERVAAATAALSRQTKWGLNRQAIYDHIQSAIRGDDMPIRSGTLYAENDYLAHDLLRGNEVLNSESLPVAPADAGARASLGGPKSSAFAQNPLAQAPVNRRAVIDTHAGATAFGGELPKTASGNPVKLAGRRYNVIESAFNASAKKLGIRPDQLQAGVWPTRAEDFAPLSPYNFVREEGNADRASLSRLATTDGATGRVPVTALAPLVRHGPRSTPESFAALKADIAKNGIKEPIRVEVDPETGKALLTDGDHRFAAAVELGHSTVPVRIEHSPGDAFMSDGEQLLPPMGGVGRFVREDAGSGRLDLGLTGNAKNEEFPLTRADAARIRAERAAARTGTPSSYNTVPGEPPTPTNRANPGRMGSSGGQRPPDARTPGPLPPPTPPARPPRDMLSLGENIAGIPKTLSVGLSPEHAVGRHLAGLQFSHPSALGKGIVGGLKTAGETIKNPEQARISMNALNNSMRKELDARGLRNAELLQPHGGPSSGQDFIPSTMLNKIPGIGRVTEGMQNAFTQTQNISRFNAAKGEQDFIEWAKRRPMTQAEKDTSMNNLNHFTGRGFRTQTPEAQSVRLKMAAGEPFGKEDLATIASSNEKYKVARLVGRIANIPLFSPQLRSSYVRMAGDVAQAIRHPTDASSITTLRLATGTLGSVAMYVGAAKAMGLGIDTDPESSNFMKIDLGPKDAARSVISLLGSQLGVGISTQDDGHVYLDPTHSMASYIKTIVQTINSKPTNNYATYPASLPPAGNFLVGLLGPGWYEAVNFLLGRQVKPTDAVLPMTVSGPLDAAGVNLPTVQKAGIHLYQGEKPATIQIPFMSPSKPSPTPKPTKKP